MLALAAEHDVLVVADEIHAPLVLPGARHTVAATMPEAAGVRLLTVTSATKAWNLPGLKCALAVPAEPSLRRALRRLPVRDRLGASILGIEASAVAFEEGAGWLAAVRAHLDRNRRLLADLLAVRLPEVGYLPPEATYLAWLDCRPLGLADPARTFYDAGRVRARRRRHVRNARRRVRPGQLRHQRGDPDRDRGPDGRRGAAALNPECRRRFGRHRGDG